MARSRTLLAATALAAMGSLGTARATYIPTPGPDSSGVFRLPVNGGVVNFPSSTFSFTTNAGVSSSGSTATTLSSAVLDSTGTKLTLTFSQADTLTLADFSVSVAGTAASLTDADAATSGTTHVLTLATAATYQQAVTLSATPVAATSPALGAVISGATVTNNSTVGAPAATTLSSAVVASSGTALTLTFNQAVTLVTADFSVSVAGTADSFTDSDAGTSSSTHVLTLATAAASGQAVTVSASPVAATNSALSAAISGQTVTNNSTATAAIALGGATFSPANITNATISQASTNGPIKVVAPDNGNVTARQGFLTPMNAQGTYIFKIVDNIPAAGNYTGGLMYLSGADYTFDYTNYYSNSGGTIGITTYSGYNGGNPNFAYNPTSNSIPVIGTTYCKALVYDGSNISIELAPVNTSGQCAVWTLMGTYPASNFGGGSGSVGIFVNAQDTGSANASATETLSNYEFTTNTSPSAMPTF